MKSTTARTKSLFESQGYIVALAEKWSEKMKRRFDLFGFADLIAFHPDKPEVILLQSTSGDHHAERKAKIVGIPAAREWIQFTCRAIAVVSFRKKVWRKKDGKKAKEKRWEPRIEFITKQDFPKEIPF